MCYQREVSFTNNEAENSGFCAISVSKKNFLHILSMLSAVGVQIFFISKIDFQF